MHNTKGRWVQVRRELSYAGAGNQLWQLHAEVPAH